MNYVHPEYLIEPAELFLFAGRRQPQNFRRLGATTHSSNGYSAEPGFAHYQKEHIPGAGFIDLLNDWSDTTSPLNNTLLPPEALAKAIGDVGISANHKVVLYSSGHIMWATRAWWCLYYATHKYGRIERKFECMAQGQITPERRYRTLSGDNFYRSTKP